METTIMGYMGTTIRNPKVCKIMAFMAIIMGVGLRGDLGFGGLGSRGFGV